MIVLAESASFNSGTLDDLRCFHVGTLASPYYIVKTYDGKVVDYRIDECGKSRSKQWRYGSKVVGVPLLQSEHLI